jgi:hypothetical protein
MLRRKIELQLQYTVENHLLMIDFKELPVTTNAHFITAWKRKKAALHAWRRELLIEAYGKRIEPYIGDIVAIFRGILIEYLTYVQQKVIALPMPELAGFISGRLDAVVDEIIRTAPKPVIDGRNIHDHDLHPSDTQIRQATVRQLIELLNARIGELSRPEEARDKLRQVASLLGEACGRESPDRTLVRVFAAYLEAVPEPRPFIRQLNYLLS